MKLEIEETTELNQIKSRFNNLYPFLKLEFFSEKHEDGEGSHKSGMIDKNQPVKEVDGKKGVVNLDDNTTVAKLESDFQDNTGLNVQVFRKSGKVWLETINSDSWTLSEQNNHAKEKEQ